MMHRRAISTLCALVAIGAARPIAAENLAPGAARVGRAVALVASPTTGTAFAVSSTAGRTVFLTAAHVVGCASVEACAAITLTVYLNGDLRSPRSGSVIAVGNADRGNDLAAFVVAEGPLPVVELGVSLAAGRSAAVLGYPVATLGALRNRRLEASAATVLSIGTVRADDGTELQGDFETFPGDSGGPIFEPISGRVAGIVHGQAPNGGAYLAVGANAISRFMQRLADAPGAAPRSAVAIASAGAAPPSATVGLDAGVAGAAYARALRLRSADPGAYARELRTAADAGNGVAADDLALAYRSSTLGVGKSRELSEFWAARALELLKPAADRGDGAALYRLSQIAQRGELTPGDPRTFTPEFTEKASLDYLQRAIRAGNADAMFELGRDYHSGYKVSHDVTQARRWYCVAAVNGHSDAAQWLAYLYSQYSDAPWPKDPATSMRWYEIENALRGTAAAQAVVDARALCAKAGVKV